MTGYELGVIAGCCSLVLLVVLLSRLLARACRLSIRLGQTDLTLEALTRLGPGATFDLSRSPDDPVEVLVNGHLVALAEIVVGEGTCGVRILEVIRR